MITRKYNSS